LSQINPVLEPTESEDFNRRVEDVTEFAQKSARGGG
jgi:hypothetical protein